MLSKMSGGNFNWFLHVMLFMHSLNIIQKQQEKDNREDNEDDAEIDIEGEE
jgi:hypothetical protein